MLTSLNVSSSRYQISVFTQKDSKSSNSAGPGCWFINIGLCFCILDFLGLLKSGSGVTERTFLHIITPGGRCTHALSNTHQWPQTITRISKATHAKIWEAKWKVGREKLAQLSRSCSQGKGKQTEASSTLSPPKNKASFLLALGTQSNNNKNKTKQNRLAICFPTKCDFGGCRWGRGEKVFEFAK